MPKGYSITNTPRVYKKDNEKKYAVKYNFTVYDAVKKKNVNKAKWKYGFESLTEAKRALAVLDAGSDKGESKEITLQGAYDLWEMNLKAKKNYSPVSIRNTQQQMKMIEKFIPLDTKIKDITDDVYTKFCGDVRAHGYSEETMHNINACFRKLINLCYKKRLITDNVLNHTDNMQTGKKSSDEYRLITKEEFDKLDEYYRDNHFVRLGIDSYPTYRVIINILYYTGIRLGELLALTPSDFDFEKCRVSITKSYVSDIDLVKSPKNLKHRDIPIPEEICELIKNYINENIKKNRLKSQMFTMNHSAVSTMLRDTSKKLNMETCNAHAFRHTYISNLIRGGVPLPVVEKVSGDTQETILKRYSHLFAEDDSMVLGVLSDL